MFKRVPLTESKRGDLVTWRPPFAEFPQMSEVISAPNKRLKRVLGEGGIKGEKGNPVEIIPQNRICTIRQAVKEQVKVPICNLA